MKANRNQEDFTIYKAAIERKLEELTKEERFANCDFHCGLFEAALLEHCLESIVVYAESTREGDNPGVSLMILAQLNGAVVRFKHAEMEK